MVWHNNNIDPEFENAFIEIHKKIQYEDSIDRDQISRSNTLFQLARSVSELNGDFAECGPYSGISSYYLAKNCKTNLHLFDSWQGVSKLTNFDNLIYNELKFDKVSLEDTQYALNDFSNIKYYKGWIPERFIEVENIKFSLVHIDLDIYEPTRDSIDFFWPKIVPGGIMICDWHDGVSTGVQKATLDYFNGIIDIEMHPEGVAVMRRKYA